ncbi:MAG TPA: NUDIX domain-containing protein [Actinomycetota bacterium]|nr:NUDIX domain-containing protein [Actinomycetota bacterium]
MRAFKHCPTCGSKLGEPTGEGGARCDECDRLWHWNPAPTVGCVIVQDDRALLTVRAREPEKGKVDIPGGFLEPGEDPIAGLKRELREELGVDVEATVSDCLTMTPHEYGERGDFVLALGFRARLVAGDPQPSDDVEAIRWIGRGELEDVDFAWEHDRELVRMVLTGG